ncbi:hypothetical protein DV736_g2611, partial [Chaetothyriales sp. CBS 134916]
MAHSKQQSTRDGSSKSVYLTLEQWEELKEPIRQLYLVQGLSLKLTRNTVRDQYGVFPTERVYKSRFEKWGWDVKKLNRQQYRALMTVHGHLTDRFEDRVHFLVRTAAFTRTYNSTSIKKELNRKPAQSVGERPLNVNEAIGILTQHPGLHVRAVVGETELDIDTITKMDLKSGIGSTHSASPRSEATGGPGPHASVPIAPPLARATLGYSTSRTCRCPPSSAHEEYDYDAELTDMFKGVTIDIVTWTPERPSDRVKSLMANWSVPYVLQCLMETAVLDSKPGQRPFSSEALSIALNETVENKHILLCLNWVICVLYFNCRVHGLRQFVEESSALVRAKTPAESVLRLPFDLMSAWLRDDAAELSRLGAELRQAYPQVRRTFPDSHPHSVVYFYFSCWYSLEHEKSSLEARSELQNALPMLKRSLGFHNSLVSQSMVMLGRSFNNTRHYADARMILSQALESIGSPCKHMVAYRLYALELLAEAETGFNELEAAQKHLEEVLAGRLALFGLGSNNEAATSQIWCAVYELCEVMKQLGKVHEAGELRRRYHMEHEEARRHWFVERNQTPPEIVPPPFQTPSPRSPR